MSSKNQRVPTTAYNVFIQKQTKQFQKSFTEADQLWSELSKKQKNDYRKMAKKQNEGIRTINRSIPASLQKSYMDRLVEKLLNNKYASKAIAKDYVQNAFDIGKLDAQVFCIFSVSYFYENQSEIFPCEIGISKFSLKDGVIDSMSMKINPGQLPKGAACEALLHAKETHQYNIPKEGDKEDDYVKINLQIIKFMSPDFLKVPIIFTEGGYVENRTVQKQLINTKRALVKIFEKAGEYSIAVNLQVVPVSFLLYYIHRCNCLDKKSKGQEFVPFESTAEAHVNFFNQHFEHTTDGCEFHNDCDNKKNCCLSKVRRFGFKLAELCCQPKKYPLIEGCHYPMGYNVKT